MSEAMRGKSTRSRQLLGHYPLIILTTANFLYYMDRYVLFMLVEPIRVEFELTDSQIGILTGIAFAVSYAIVAIPVGRLTDTSNRVRILAVSVTIWSLFTAAFGFAKSYIQMIFLRIGVALGEAGGFIPVQSLVADFYRAEKRGGALGILMSGANIGKLAAFGLAGWLNDIYGWRVTFIVIGSFGLILGPILIFTLKEPKRGLVDGIAVQTDGNRMTLRSALTRLFGRRSFSLLLMGFTVLSIAHYSILAWLATYFIRRFELTTTEAGFLMSAAVVLPTLIGTVVGGFASNYLYRIHPNRVVYAVGVATSLAFPAIVLQVFAPTLPVMIAVGVVPAFILGFYLPPTLLILQTLAGNRLRGTGGALIVFTLLLVGQGLGPSVSGILSDLFSVTNEIVSFAGLRKSLATVSVLMMVGGSIMLCSVRYLESDIKLASDFDESDPETQTA